ncbi:MAG: hypothetical protein ACE5HD_03535 [Acidobacteriota bacterium]
MGRTGKLALLLLGGVLAAGQGLIFAQGADQGIPLGKGIFYPAIAIEGASDDNLFQQEDDRISVNSTAIGPDLEWHLPLSRSLLTLIYKPRLRRYENNVIPSTTSHRFDGEFTLELPSDTLFTVKDSFERGNLEIREFTGGEPTFGGDRFTRNVYQAGFEMPIGPRQKVEIGLFGGSTRFDELESASFIDLSDQGVLASWSISLTTELDYRVEARGSRVREDRPPVRFLDFQSQMPILLQDLVADQFDQRSIRSGLEGRIGKVLETRTFLGFTIQDFEDSAQSDYRGPTLESEWRLRLTSSLGVRVLARRQPFASAFNVANFFVAEDASAFLEWQTPRRLTVSVGGSRQKNSYKDPIQTNLDGSTATGINAAGDDILPDPSTGFVTGVFRKDRIRRVEGRVEFAFRPHRLAAFVELIDERRASNITFSQFNRRVVRLGLRFGWFRSGSGGI